eukprot:UN00284
MGAEMGALVLDRKLSASMKKLVKTSTSRQFLDYVHIENRLVKAAPFSETLFR